MSKEDLAPLKAAILLALQDMPAVDGAYLHATLFDGSVTVSVFAKEHGTVDREALLKIEEGLSEAHRVRVTLNVRAHQGRSILGMVGGDRQRLLFAREAGYEVKTLPKALPKEIWVRENVEEVRATYVRTEECDGHVRYILAPRDVVAYVIKSGESYLRGSSQWTTNRNYALRDSKGGATAVAEHYPTSRVVALVRKRGSK